MYDWLIIGGGLQGSFVAQALRDAVPHVALAVLDDRRPLDAWQRRAAACGMDYLRSSNAHHMGQRADALRRFAAAKGYDGAHELGYYRRPSRALFEAHAAAALHGGTRIADRGARLERIVRGWRVHCRSGASVDTTRVVLALGPNAPRRPDWARGCEHVYDLDFDGLVAADARTVVVGGGISGAQLALRLQSHGRPVYWVTRERPQVADFDSDPCYAGPRCLAPFKRTPIAARTALLTAARRPGTLPPDIHARITAALAAREIGWRCGEVVARDAGGVAFADGRHLAADRVILATGFQTQPASDSLLARCIRDHALRCDRDGHVFIDDALQAAPGLHLLGRPASLQLGPMAGNIQGARLAGRRLAALAAAAIPARRSI